ncbi:MAG: DNA mismatch repair protein MutS [Phycisphaerales bacterium]|nr:DNA mismatch repair protein MutS [Phycisphaerales bacterium]
MADQTKLTPAMQQYQRFKQRHPDCVLFFRMGDFYEMFNDDAVTAHRALGITLTQRTPGVPMAGVPHHAVDSYIRRMIEQGYRVAVCDQVQDPKEAKGVVDRAVTRVITPGTLVDDSLLSDADQNVVAAVAFTESGDRSAGVIAAVEASTGSFVLCDTHSDRLVDDLMRIGPRELLYADTATGEVPPRVSPALEALGIAGTPRPAWHFRLADATEAVLEHFQVATVDGFGLSMDDPALAPAGAVLRYLQETQAPNADGPSLSHLQAPKRERSGDFVVLDAAVLRSLEIERTMRTGGTDGSLLGTLNRCKTPMGRRLLRQWLCFPLAKRAGIEARLGIVGAFVEDRRLAQGVLEHVGVIQDVARIAGRLGIGRATPRDLVALGASTGHVQRLREYIGDTPALARHAERLSQLCEPLVALSSEITEACVDHPPTHTREGGVIRDGYDAQLDECRALQRDASTWLAQYQKSLIERTGIARLKIGYNRVFGYYIELSRANAASAPDDFTRKQTLKNAERYITPELKEYETKITSAEARAIEREQRLFTSLCESAAMCASQLAEFAQVVAELDILLCFADRAVRCAYVRPTIVDEPVLDVVQGRHAVLDERLGDGFVPNDCALGVAGEDGADAFTLALITGPNMSGKSTYIRQNALIVLLAHVGSFVPAQTATIGLTDRIFTRIGASDELHLGQSTFMIEMIEAANILHHATTHSLIILDEIGRGTSTLDGLSLAWAIAEYLAAARSRTLFATHYHELTDLADTTQEGRVGNLHVAVREWEGDVIFLHRILPGRTDQSYGIHVAKIAGLPPTAVDRAQDILKNLEATHACTRLGPADVERTPKAMEQLPLFTEYIQHPAVDRLREVSLDNLTPMQAFDLLRQLREEIDGS